MVGRYTWILSVLLLPAAFSALADGSFFAQKEIPPIPAQRALITYRDGVERLVIDSNVGSGGKELAWVIPVPAEPMEFRKASPGLVKTLSLCTAPRVITGSHMDPFMISLAIIVIATLAWMRFLVVQRPTTWMFLLSLVKLVAVSAIALAFGLLSGTLGATRGAPDNNRVSGVEITQQVRVGDYDIAVLRVDNAGGFQQWLAGNGFTGLPAEGVPIVDDYIREDWRFVAAKLVRNEEKGVSAHSVEITFPAKQPVYPMRLTALAKTDVYLEIFVLADTSAQAAGLEKEASSRLEVREGSMGKRAESHVFLYGPIRHPEFFDYAWDGCMLTRLSGVVPPSAMTSDIAIEMTASREFRRIYYTRSEAVIESVLAGGYAGIPICLIGAFVVWRRSRERDGRALMVRVLLLAMVVGTAVGLYSASQKRIGVVHERHHVELSLPSSTVEELAGTYGDFANAGLAGNPAALAESFFTYTIQVNWITGERLRLEDSPGNILLSPSENGIVLFQYDHDGAPMDTYFPCISGEEAAGQNQQDGSDGGEASSAGEAVELTRSLLARESQYLAPDDVRLLLGCKKHAAELRPFALARLKRLLPIRRHEERTARLYLNVLGFMTETVPPFDFSQEAVEDFIKKASERELEQPDSDAAQAPGADARQ